MQFPRWTNSWVQRGLLLAGFIVGAALLIYIRLDPTDDRTQAVLHEQSGGIVIGQRFGVTIGESFASADAKIRRYKLRYVTVDRPGTLDGKDLAAAQRSVTYRDGSWHNGVITLVIENERVVAIIWHYPGPFYVDL